MRAVIELILLAHPIGQSPNVRFGQTKFAGKRMSDFSKKITIGSVLPIKNSQEFFHSLARGGEAERRYIENCLFKSSLKKY